MVTWTRFAEKANKCTETFFDEVPPLHVSWDTAQRGLRLLQRFVETVGDGLGLAKSGFSGPRS